MKMALETNATMREEFQSFEEFMKMHEELALSDDAKTLVKSLRNMVCFHLYYLHANCNMAYVYVFI